METRYTEKEYLYWLCQVPNLGAVKIRKLWEQFGSFSDIYYIEEKYLEQTDYLYRRDRENIVFLRGQLGRNVEAYHRLGSMGIQFITPLDPEYPRRLRPMYDMPMGLYVKGRLPDDKIPTVAVIGARAGTSYGREAAGYFASELGQAGVQIISGMASGIDGAGHQGALSVGASTYGVLGCGVDICYPKENWKIYESMVTQGGVISEYPPGTGPLASHFPVRNRILSGFSDLILVMEARQRSGSLITVNLALEQGKDVFALPGRLTDDLSAGCNQLIEAGAGILTGPERVLEALGIEPGKLRKLCEKKRKGLAKTEKMVYSCLDLHPKHLDEVVRLSGIAVNDCMSILLELELNGFVKRSSGQYYEKALDKEF